MKHNPPPPQNNGGREFEICILTYFLFPQTYVMYSIFNKPGNKKMQRHIRRFYSLAGPATTNVMIWQLPKAPQIFFDKNYRNGAPIKSGNKWQGKRFHEIKLKIMLQSNPGHNILRHFDV